MDKIFNKGVAIMISIGIDVSKGKSTVCISKLHREILNKPFEVKHTLEELKKLADKIISFDEESKVILEATGHYHIPVVSYLQERGIFVCVVNPMLMKKYASISIRKGKTDKLDSKIISKFGLDNWYELSNYKVEEDTYYELKTLSRQYFQFMSLRIKLKVMLSNLLDETMPGIAGLLASNSISFAKDKLSDFVQKYWHYDNIIKLSENKFTESYKKWAKKEGYQFSENKAHEIYILAKNSITTMSSKMSSTKMIISETIKGIHSTGISLNLILSRMKELAKLLPEYDVVLNMNGVGERLAPRIIAEVGDIRKYYSAKALVAYSGIDAPPYQSGNFNGNNRKISKRGSRYLRKTGYEIMKSIKCRVPTKDAAVYDYIIKKESEGKAKKQAKIAGLNKFLRIYYARVSEVLKN